MKRMDDNLALSPAQPWGKIGRTGSHEAPYQAPGLRLSHSLRVSKGGGRVENTSNDVLSWRDPCDILLANPDKLQKVVPISSSQTQNIWLTKGSVPVLPYLSY